MNGNFETLRNSVETIRGQLDALERGVSSQPQQSNLEAVTPDILAAAVAALERHLDECAPVRMTSSFLNIASLDYASRSKAGIEHRIDLECEDRERKIDVLNAQIARLYRTSNHAS